MDAIVTAGGVPKLEEPLYPFTQGGCKALLDVAGKPMIQWVLDALSGSPQIERVAIVGLPSDAPVTCGKPLLAIESRGDIIDNVLTGISALRSSNPRLDSVLVVASDIPGITSEMVNWMVNLVEKSDCEVIYTAVSRQVMENRYPDSHRTYVRFKDIEVTGGDIHSFRASIFSKQNPRWRRIVDERKHPLKQASLIGFDILVSILLHRLTLLDAGVRISRRLGLAGRVMLCPFAEVGMDVDKPHQLELMRANLARRNSS